MADDLDLGLLDRAVELELVPNFQRLFQGKGIRFSNAFVTKRCFEVQDPSQLMAIIGELLVTP